MPDNQAPLSGIQNSFATGEVSPGLYGRTDLQKYHSGCAQLQNWYVDYKGGATVRPGSQYIGGPGVDGFTRLVPFQFSPVVGQTYILVFADLVLRFIKNPGTPSYPNSSNSGFIESGGSPYEVVTPYTAAILPQLKFVQVKDVMYLTAPGTARMKLSRVADDNWTLAEVVSAPTIDAPTISAGTISALPAGSTDPEETYYMYRVSAVAADGSESLPSAPFVVGPGLNIGTTQGTVTIFWDPVTDAKWYKVYKALPTQGLKYPDFSEQFGFAGFAYGTIFTDSNIVADYVRQPIRDVDPFAASQIVDYTIAASSADWPVGGTTIDVTDATGSGAVIYPILDNNDASGVGSIIGLYIERPGSDYTAPTLAAMGGGTTFTGSAVLSDASGTEPEVVGLAQQRIYWASTTNRPAAVFASRPGYPEDMRVSNPVVPNDALDFDLFSEQAINITWLRAMPGGLVIGTNANVVQLTGGSASANNPQAITPTNAVVVPQSNYGATDVSPIVIDYDIIFVTPEGLVIDLQYNFFVNIFTGTDITVMSSHLFEQSIIMDWAYQDKPRKIIWAVRDDGKMLSCTFFKAQEIQGWAPHETNGFYESIAAVREGTEIAIYYTVNRFGESERFIERMSGSDWPQKSAAWQLDSAMSVAPTFPAANLQPTATTGTNILCTASAAVFSGADVGKHLYAGAAHAVVVAAPTTTTIQVDIILPFAGGANPVPIAGGDWSLDAEITSFQVAHLADQEVWALVDGEVQGPFAADGSGNVTLSSGGARVVCGLKFKCLLQPLYGDFGSQGEVTVQGRRKKVTAASVRVKDAAGLEFGPDPDHMQTWVEGQSSTDPELSFPYGAPDLYNGDQRMAINQIFTVGGWVRVEQNQPLPATVLAIIPEYAQGDTR